MEVQTFFASGSSLTWQDYSVLLVLLALLIFVGFYTGREEKSTNDFFLGGRKIPWWAAGLAFVAAEISALTLIAVPAIAYMENWEYVQFFIGDFLARVSIAWLFIPAFYHYNCTSIYEFLKYRFGPESQIAGSILFFITRLLASGVRLMVACLAVRSYSRPLSAVEYWMFDLWVTPCNLYSFSHVVYSILSYCISTNPTIDCLFT